MRCRWLLIPLVSLLWGARDGGSVSEARHSSGGGFLFVTFRGEKTPMTEQIYFALSDDGKTFAALHGGEPVLVSDVGEKGVRDPYLLRAAEGNRFFLLATDLSIHLNHDWKRAQERGSRSIVVWESGDLVHWSAPRLVKVAPDDAGCAWAPEAVYDGDAHDYLVFWASKTKADGFAKQRIWAARTTDFVTFSKPFIYIDNASHTIDTDIVHENGVYYRFSKDESVKAVTMERADKLMGPWKAVDGFSLATLHGVEGPACYPVTPPAKDGEKGTWCLLLDRYSKGQGYKPYVTHDLASGKFEPADDFSFPFLTRHGGILPLTAEEAARLKAAYPTTQPSAPPPTKRPGD